MNIYLQSGYLDARAILNLKMTFNFIIGARGVGKTYGFLDACQEDGRVFLYMRRTQIQTDMINKAEFSPFKAICNDKNIEIVPESLGKYSVRYIKNEETVCYTCALSTISNMRSIDFSDVDLIIYDEFIPERHERPMKGEGAAFLNAYETVNRNRELAGKDPVQVVCMANAFNIANPIFLELGLVGVAEKMKERRQEIYMNHERSVLIAMPTSAKITAAKSYTALYKLTRGSQFERMALKNDFVYNSADNIKPQKLQEFRPLVTVGEITIYRHKSKPLFYVCEHRSGNPPTYKTDEVDLRRYIKAYGFLLNQQYMNNNVKFENILTKSLFELYTI